MKVEIPFMDEFQDRMLSGQKTATSRTKPYGKQGDTFDAFGATFRIRGVLKLQLKDIALTYFREEGFIKPSDFRDCWRKLHPLKGWNSYQEVYTHLFVRINPGEAEQGVLV